MAILPRLLALTVLSLGALVLSAVNVSAGTAGAPVIVNNFNGVADDIGPAFQLLTNGAGAGDGSFDPATGVVTAGTGILGSGASDTNATGFNNDALATLDPTTTVITATFDIESVTNFEFVRSNGFFLGLVTGAGATGTDGSALYNNNGSSSVGLRLRATLGDDDADPPVASFTNQTQIVSDGEETGGAQVLASIPDLPDLPTIESIEDGFTFTISVNALDTFDAFTTGLSNDISVTNVALGAAPSFSDFLSGGIGINASTQGGTSSFTIASVTLEEAAIDLGIAGDFNDDGVVDAADYTIARDGGGTSGDVLTDFNEFVANFGASSAPPEALTVSAVPEPAASALVAVMVGLAGLRRSRSRS